VGTMRPPIFVRSLSATEKEQLQTALRSSEAFVMRRAQIILASHRGERASRIGRWFEQSVRVCGDGYSV
jgi:hypothetical protein